MPEGDEERTIKAAGLIEKGCLHEAGVMPVDSQKKLSGILNTLSQENEELPVLLHEGTEREIPTSGRKKILLTIFAI